MRNSRFLTVAFLLSCGDGNKAPSPETIQSINLKKGDLIWCGPETANFGAVNFSVSTDADTRKMFNQAIAILHSFEYIEAEKAFAAVIEKDPACAMAYWGVAMSNFHPLWEPPAEKELKKGADALAVAKSLPNISAREADYIDAIGVFYSDWDKVDHKTRCKRYEAAMAGLYRKYPDDKEAAIFYALSLNTTADPTDKTYSNQKKAGEILNTLAGGQSDHPGVIHYIIHNYDNPDLAELALPAARKYASVAPASAHAQHMPSHIFIRLGLWDEAIESNIASINSARCYAEKAALAGNFDEELHGLDYLVYAYLQKGDTSKAFEQLEYLKSIDKVSANNLKVAYAYAAIPARYLLENKKWKEAAALELFPSAFPWNKFPWQRGIVVYARMLGKINTNDMEGAQMELRELQSLRDTLLGQKDLYKARQLEVQIRTGQAWIELKEGNLSNAETLMVEAADMEDGTMKHPVTPGEILPARELLAELYMATNQPAKAVEAYAADLKTHPGRLNALKGEAVAKNSSVGNQ